MTEEIRTSCQSQELERFAKAYVEDQIIQKKASHGWGDVTLKMTFQQGDLIQTELTDRTVVRPQNLKRVQPAAE